MVGSEGGYFGARGRAACLLGAWEPGSGVHCLPSPDDDGETRGGRQAAAVAPDWLALTLVVASRAPSLLARWPCSAPQQPERSLVARRLWCGG